MPRYQSGVELKTSNRDYIYAMSLFFENTGLKLSREAERNSEESAGFLSIIG